MSKKIDASVWGSSAWHTLHTIGLNTNVTSSNKDDYILFLNNFKNVLPCPRCRKNFTKKHSNFLINSDTMTTDNYRKWIYNIHNMVNDSTYNSKISYNEHIKKHKPYDIKKINKFTEILINQLGKEPSYKELIDCKTYLKCLLKLHPCQIKNKTSKLKKLDDIYNSVELKEWYSNIYI